MIAVHIGVFGICRLFTNLQNGVIYQCLKDWTFIFYIMLSLYLMIWLIFFFTWNCRPNEIRETWHAIKWENMKYFVQI